DYTVKHVMNITDVGQLTSDADDGDDKMVKGLKREGKPQTLEAMSELGEFYTEKFIDDLKSLNIELPHEMPRASKHIQEDADLIQILLEKDIAYNTSDGVYFDVSKFPDYGTRGGFKLGDLKEGVRVAINAEKHTPRDFALWKFSTGPIGWDAPFGRGFPGWHIECSAMSRKYLDQPFDIHTGGIDHIPVHHQNEIAQSEAAYGVPLANVWMHNAYLIFGKEKMAKSGKDVVTMKILQDHGIHPISYRYFLLQAHYRSPVNFSWEALQAAQTAYLKLLVGFSALDASFASVIPATEQQRSSRRLSGIQEFIGDDLNTSDILASVWRLLKEKNRVSILDSDRILGLDIENQSKRFAEEMNAVPEEIKKLASAREDARKAKDFKKSDELRDQIQKEGFEVMDTDSDPIVRKKL
ncbi:MAG: cysteine--tRNA ligase, partial [bacterium]|nr:cysteine--tRNA ligase [bacterium]